LFIILTPPVFQCGSPRVYFQHFFPNHPFHSRTQQRIEQCDTQRRRFIAQQLELSAHVSNGGSSNGNDKDDGFGFDATAKAEDRARLRMQVRACSNHSFPPPTTNNSWVQHQRYFCFFIKIVNLWL
jgi:hypothetical protein